MSILYILKYYKVYSLLVLSISKLKLGRSLNNLIFHLVFFSF